LALSESVAKVQEPRGAQPAYALLRWLRSQAESISKIVVAATTGGRQFALLVIPGLILVLVAAWLGALL